MRRWILQSGSSQKRGNLQGNGAGNIKKKRNCGKGLSSSPYWDMVKTVTHRGKATLLLDSSFHAEVYYTGPLMLCVGRKCHCAFSHKSSTHPERQLFMSHAVKFKCLYFYIFFKFPRALTLKAQRKLQYFTTFL